MHFFMSMIEKNVIILKHILKEKQMLWNLLVLFGSTRGIATKKNKNYQNRCRLNQAVLLNFGRTYEWGI